MEIEKGPVTAEETRRADWDFIDIKDWMWRPEGLGLRLGSLELLAFASVYGSTHHGSGIYLRSLSSAARSLGVSYRRLHEAFARLETGRGTPLLAPKLVGSGRASKALVMPNDGGELSLVRGLVVNQAAIEDAVAATAGSVGPVRDRILLEEWMWRPEGLALKLTSLPILVYARIFSATSGGKGLYAESRASLARALGVSRSSASRAMDALLDRSLVYLAASPNGSEGPWLADPVAAEEACRACGVDSNIYVEKTSRAPGTICTDPRDNLHASAETPGTICTDPRDNLHASAETPGTICTLSDNLHALRFMRKAPTSELLKTTSDNVENPAPLNRKECLRGNDGGGLPDVKLSRTPGPSPSMTLNPDSLSASIGTRAKNEARWGRRAAGMAAAEARMPVELIPAFEHLAARAKPLMGARQGEECAEAYVDLVGKGHSPADIEAAYHDFLLARGAGELTGRGDDPQTLSSFLTWSDGAPKWLGRLEAKRRETRLGAEAAAGARAFPHDVTDEEAARATIWLDEASGRKIFRARLITLGRIEDVDSPWPKTLGAHDRKGAERLFKELLGKQRAADAELEAEMAADSARSTATVA